MAESATKMDEKDKKAIKEGQKDASKVLKTAKAVLESPEANVVSKVAGKSVEDKQKQGLDIVN